MRKVGVMMTSYFNRISMCDLHAGQHLCMNIQYVAMSHSLRLKLSRNCVTLLESFIITPDFIHIWALTKPLALERG